MLTHCQKCDSPLTPGVEDCPHCGYSIQRARKTMLRKIALVAGLYLALWITGAGMFGSHIVKSGRREQILAVVRANVEAFNRRDATGLIALIHPDSAGFPETMSTVRENFLHYELRSKLTELRIESMDGNEARVRFSQVTERVSGPEFRNNRVDGVHTLRKHNGEWKLYNTEATSIIYLAN